MVGLTEAAQLATFLKSAGDIAKALVGLRDAEAVRAKVIELQAVILSAQSSAMSAQTDQHHLSIRVHELEKEIENLKDWATENSGTS